MSGVPRIADGAAGGATSGAGDAGGGDASAIVAVDPLKDFDPEDPLKVGRMKSLSEIIVELLAVKPPPVTFEAREKNQGNHENAVKAKAKKFLKKFARKAPKDSDDSSDSSEEPLSNFKLPSSEDEDPDF